MMKHLILLLTLAFAITGHAEVLKSTINSVSHGQNGEDTLILLDNGRVVFVKDDSFLSNKELSGSSVQIETDKNNYLKSISSLPDEATPEEEIPLLMEEHEPTVFESEEAATRIFKDMNTSWKRRTECTDRAHIWAYEEWKEHGLVSKKVFMFFTNTYIRRYNYHWWFHVSPYTLVKKDDQVVERVMDRRFTSKILTMKDWSDIFIRSRKSCPVTTYRHYRQNKNGPEHCFHVKSAMYYRLPLHVRGLEDEGRVKTEFRRGEVNFSYRAFRRRGSK